MRIDEATLRDVLAGAWERWGRRCSELTPAQWATPTRCKAWDVHALIAHICPDPAMFDTLESAVVDEPAAVTDAVDLLRYFNQPGGAAHTMADQVADTAVAEAAQLTPDAVVDRFTASARRVREFTLSGTTVVRYPVIGTATLAAISEVALMEATVHLLDLADAVGGIEPSAGALAATRDLLVAVPDPKAVVEVLAGRAEPAAAVPAIR
jgi:uncharacterized protein (TIGR03083 family)